MLPRIRIPRRTDVLGSFLIMVHFSVWSRTHSNKAFTRWWMIGWMPSSSELNFNLGLALIGWLGARNGRTDGLFSLSSSYLDQGGSGIGLLLSRLSGSLATSWKAGCYLEHWSCSGQTNVGSYRKLCPIVAWSQYPNGLLTMQFPGKGEWNIG